jgi:hypothetical protein
MLQKRYTQAMEYPSPLLSLLVKIFCVFGGSLQNLPLPTVDIILGIVFMWLNAIASNCCNELLVWIISSHHFSLCSVLFNIQMYDLTEDCCTSSCGHDSSTILC